MMKIDEFVSRHRLHGTWDDFCHCLELFRSEMDAGLQGEPSSLLMLPSYIDAAAGHDFSQPVIAIDAGGTTLRCSRLSLGEDSYPAIEHQEKMPLPGSRSAVTIEHFHDELAAAVSRAGETDSRIGLAFSFPCEILPDRDGRILFFAKEIEVLGSEGTVLGEGLAAAFKRAALPPQQSLTVLNDSTATLLAARAATDAHWSTYIGFVLGTGLNACYVEQNKNISKDAVLREREGRSIVNLEAGGFNKMPRSAVDLEFDASTNNPGQQTLEKLISGAYLAPLLRLYISHAAEEGCFAEEVCQRLPVLDELDASHITTFGSGTTPLDEFVCQYALSRSALCVLLDAFLERAAVLIAAMLTSLLIKSGVTPHDELPACISADGSVFSRCAPLREKVFRKMRDFAEGKLGLRSEFVEIENATLLGTALAAALEQG